VAVAAGSPTSWIIRTIASRFFFLYLDAHVWPGVDNRLCPKAKFVPICYRWRPVPALTALAESQTGLPEPGPHVARPTSHRLGRGADVVL
jgi:hypothetical protein